MSQDKKWDLSYRGGERANPSRGPTAVSSVTIHYMKVLDEIFVLGFLLWPFNSATPFNGRYTHTYTTFLLRWVLRVAAAWLVFLLRWVI